MQFSNTATKDGVLQDIESLVFSDDYGRITSNTKLLQTFTRYSNRALDRVTQLIFSADGRWQWDDKNNANYPIASTDLISGQVDYPFDVTHLQIHQIEVRNRENTDWGKLQSIDPNGHTKPLSSVFSTGTPIFYDKLADAPFLYPTPDYNMRLAEEGIAGIKVTFQRGASYFVTTDTTKAPGFASNFHRLISLWASYDYAFSKQLPIAKVLRDEIALMEEALKDFYSTRSKDEHIRLIPRRFNFR